MCVASRGAWALLPTLHEELDEWHGTPNNYANRARQLLDSLSEHDDVRDACLCILTLLEGVRTADEAKVSLWVAIDAHNLGFPLPAAKVVARVLALAEKYPGSVNINGACVALAAVVVDVTCVGTAEKLCASAKRRHRTHKPHRDGIVTLERAIVEAKCASEEVVRAAETSANELVCDEERAAAKKLRTRKTKLRNKEEKVFQKDGHVCLSVLRFLGVELDEEEELMFIMD
jgi:hypothetical protein